VLAVYAVKPQVTAVPESGRARARTRGAWW
jgi:hypothetical protein